MRVQQRDVDRKMVDVGPVEFEGGHQAGDSHHGGGRRGDEGEGAPASPGPGTEILAGSGVDKASRSTTRRWSRPLGRKSSSTGPCPRSVTCPQRRSRLARQLVTAVS